VLDRSLVDKWYKCEDFSTLNMSRRLILEEGLLCGGSCGAAMLAAI
jgi:cystathionine beta-synthase